jgi:hypothetical protein
MGQSRFASLFISPTLLGLTDLDLLTVQLMKRQTRVSGPRQFRRLPSAGEF